MSKVLFVATDPEYARHLRAALAEPDIHVAAAGQSTEVQQALISVSPIDVIFVDERFLDGDGLSLMREARTRHPDVTLVLFAELESPSSSLVGGSLGAHFFLPRSADPGQFRLVCRQAIERTALRRERDELRSALAARTTALWLAVDSVADGRLVVHDDQVVLVNRSFWELVGMTPEVVEGEPADSVLARLLPGLDPGARAEIGQSEPPRTWVVARGDRSLELTCARLSGVGWRSTELWQLRDVADRAASVDLPDSEQRYQAVVTSLEEGILLHDGGGVLRSWNESAVRILGRDADGGISFDPFRHPERFTRQDGSPFPPGEQPTARALQRGEPSTRVILRVTARADQVVWVEVNAQPMRDARDGRIVGVVSTLTDITEQIRLREDEQRLRARLLAAATEWLRTFDSVDSPIAVVDAHGTIQRLNRAARELIAEPFVDILGKHLCDIPGEPFATAADLVRRATPQSVPAFDARANRHWEVTLSVLTGGGEAGDANLRRWVVSAREVTQLLDLQASLHRSRIMAAMGTLVAEVAHEVRNPLFALSAYLDVFEARFGAEPEYSRYVQNFRAQIGRLRYLMQDLLEYSKGSPMERREPAHFEDLVAEAVSAAEFVAQQRAITIVQDSAPSLPRVQANAARLVTAIHNLIQNAIQHSPTGGVVHVNTRLIVRGGRLVECSVTDSGPGFRDEDLPKIFLPFFSRRSGGTGLGLAIVQHIVESHDGTIEARNIPNGGAMISFRLPVERGA